MHVPLSAVGGVTTRGSLLSGAHSSKDESACEKQNGKWLSVRNRVRHSSVFLLRVGVAHPATSTWGEHNWAFCERTSIRGS